jgi:chromosome segregation ATPase
MHIKLKVEYDAAVTKEESARKQLNLAIEEAGRREQKLKDDNNVLNIRIGQLTTERDEAKRRADEKDLLANKWEDLTTEFTNTNERQRQWLEDTLAKLKAIEVEQIKGDKELKETTAALIEKMTIIETLEKQSRLLLEEKTYLQNELDKLLRQSGRAVAPPVPVTPTKEKVRVAPPTVDIGLKGLITAVDLENSLAEISIGAASGVKPNMKFHVTRADKFICDIVILDVEPEKAIGALELMDVTKEQPKAGDNVSTNL